MAHGDSLSDHLGPRSLALGDSLRADARGATSIALNPSGLPGNSELVFEGTYGYRIADSASSVTLSGCDSTNPAPGCFYYRYLNSSPTIAGIESGRRAHEGGLALSRAVTPGIFVGSTIRYFDYNSDLPGEEDSSGFTFDSGITVLLMPQVRVGLVGHHLFGKKSAQYPRAIGSGIVLRPIPTLSLSLDGLWRLERPDGQSTGRYGGGLEYFFQSADRQSGFPIRLGAVHDVQDDGTYLSGGLGFMSAKMAFDVGLRRQVAGGDELVIQAGLRLFGPRPARRQNRRF